MLFFCAFHINKFNVKTSYENHSSSCSMIVYIRNENDTYCNVSLKYNLTDKYVYTFSNKKWQKKHNMKEEKK